MASDFWIVLQWWGTLFLVGAMAYPLTKKLFSAWFDHGYFFSKAVGMATVTWIVYAMGTIRVMPFSVGSIAVAMGVVFVLGIGFHRGSKGSKGSWGRILIEEIFFLMAIFAWSWVKAHESSIRGLEKFMDYGFMQSILGSQFFPPGDMWYAGSPINYYYFGHMVTAVLTKLSGLDLAYTFNLMLATLFALTLTMSYSIGYQLACHSRESGNPVKTNDGSPIRSGMTRILAGTLTAFLVTMAGNMQTIYAFIKGFANYWYADATRFIPFTIHEFPSYSFVVSDIHGHVLSIPFVLLAIALLLHFSRITSHVSLVFYGFLVGVLLMTNALDGPIYLALFVLLLFVTHRSQWLNVFSVLAAALVTSLPFLFHFKSFVTGLAVNCPPGFLANTKIGPIIFEEVEKCQVSPLWMWWLLWGFFVYCGGSLIYNYYNHYKNYNGYNRIQKILTIFFLFALGLVIFPEFFYFKDIYPAHFRSNTMFKLGYQAFILFSIVAGHTITSILSSPRRRVSSPRRRGSSIFLLLLLPQLFLVSIFPIFAVRSYFGGLKKYEGIYGLNWIAREYSEDRAAIEWLKGQGRGVLVEADGDSYTDYARFSAFTGMPTIIGWPVHEWLWRGSYDVVAPRREDVRQIYESEDLEVTRNVLVTYGVRYVVVGKLEREKYKNLAEWKFGQIGREAFRSGQIVIYEIIE